jgi:hypothetical protein
LEPSCQQETQRRPLNTEIKLRTAKRESAICVRNHAGLMLGCHAFVKKQKPWPDWVEARVLPVLSSFVFADCYFRLLIALLPLECRVPFVPRWAPFEPIVEL